MGINDAQRRLIFRLLRALGVDDSLRPDLVGALTDGRTQHVSELSCSEAARMIDWLKHQAGETSPAAGFRAPAVSNRASAQQLWKIRQLETALGWADEPDRLAGFVRKFAGIDRLEWLTPLKASNVIEGLKAVLSKDADAEGSALA